MVLLLFFALVIWLRLDEWNKYDMVTTSNKIILSVVCPFFVAISVINAVNYHLVHSIYLGYQLLGLERPSIYHLQLGNTAFRAVLITGFYVVVFGIFSIHPFTIFPHLILLNVFSLLLCGAYFGLLGLCLGNMLRSQLSLVIFIVLFFVEESVLYRVGLKYDFIKSWYFPFQSGRLIVSNQKLVASDIIAISAYTSLFLWLGYYTLKTKK
jgi:hypothetical protein